MTTLKPEDVDGVAVLCESCGTAITKPSEEQAKQTASGHNDSRHNGESVAEAVTSTVDVDASQLPTEQRKKFIQQVIALLDR